MNFLTWLHGWFLYIRNFFSPPKRRYGWRRDLPDFRDQYLKIEMPLESLPASVDLRPNCPPVYNQGELGSCTANAIAGLVQFDELKLKRPVTATPSRLFVYYNERLMEGSVGSDSGAALRDGIKSLNTYGFCPETMWPYIIAKFTTKPSQACYANAKQHIVQQYQRVPQTAAGIKSVLASGFPVVFGATLYGSFESNTVAATGVVPMPGHNESPIGGHAIMIVGYDDAKKWFIVRNSWGTTWGAKGYCYFPYDYILNADLCSDFWTVKFVP